MVALSHVPGGLIFQLEAKIKHDRSWEIFSIFLIEKKLKASTLNQFYYSKAGRIKGDSTCAQVTKMFLSTWNLVSPGDSILSVCCLHFQSIQHEQCCTVPTSHLLTHAWPKTSLKENISVWRFWLSEHCSSCCTVLMVNYPTASPQRSFSTLEAANIRQDSRIHYWASLVINKLHRSPIGEHEIQVQNSDF